MKVVFLQDVFNVAKAGEIKEIARGYARNFLIPKKLAILATPSAIDAAKIELKVRARRQKQSEAQLGELAQQLEGKELILKARTGARERLYGSITTADIAAELEKTAGVAIDKRKIELDQPIRQLGVYDIVIRLGKDLTPRIRVTVVEKEPEPGA